MDPFKLLSRSTNLHNFSSSNVITARNIPSAAASDHLEKNRSDHVNVDGGNSRGKKRRRASESNGTESHTLPMGVKRDSMKLANPSLVDHTNRATNAIDDQIKNAPGIVKGDTTFDRGEWRKVLKQNRVKVTLLEPGLQDADDRKMRHKRLSTRDEQAHSRKNKAHAQLTSRPLQSFNYLNTEYGVSKRLGLNLDAQGYKTPTEVQLGAIPLLLGSDFDRGLQLDSKKENGGRRRSEVDLLTVAPTGSGKTLAFLIHLLHGLRQNRRHRKNDSLKSKTRNESPQAIVLAPTHELVDQIVLQGKKLAKGTGSKVSRLRKGMKLSCQGSSADESGEKDMLDVPRDGHLDDQRSKSVTIKADILVSTPLLLLHAIALSPESNMTLLADVRYLVLDEADVLLDPLFRAQTLEVYSLCNNAELQTSLWSATIGSSIEDLAQNFILDRRRRLRLDVKEPGHHIVRLVVGLKDSAVPNISHRLVYAATEQGKLMALRQMIHPTAATVWDGPPLDPPYLVFTQTIPRAVALHSELLYEVPPEAGGSSRIAVLHSDLSDNTRSAIMAGFRNGDIWILITTDLLARGIDFRGVNGVVNYDIPNTSGIYVHRVGRTGRQGREGGVAVTLYTKEDIKYVKNVANVIAASEKQKRKLSGAEEAGGLQEWLLSALPDVSKEAKKDLKIHGVEARRTARKAKDGGREARRMRISTKSGYDRTMEQKKKQAVAAPHRTSAKEGSGSDEEWKGIDD